MPEGEVIEEGNAFITICSNPEIVGNELNPCSRKKVKISENV